MLGHIKNDLINYIGNMDKLYLLQFACFVFMLVSAGYLGLSSLHVHWRNRRFERSRWMLFLALLVLGAHYLLQMVMKIRVAGDDLGAVVNMLVYTPCFMLISKAIYNRAPLVYFMTAEAMGMMSNNRIYSKIYEPTI